MEKIRISVGIIDDDEAKRTQIMSNLEACVEDASEEIQDQYSMYELYPIELEIKADMNEVIDEIIENEINVLIVDYKLASYETVADYTGVKFANRTNDKFMDFPLFILTSFETELYKHESFNAYQVFDFERYMNEQAERIELNRKIIEQYLKYKNQIEKWKEELSELLQREGESDVVDKKIMELDHLLEKSFDGDNAIPDILKERLSNDKYETVIELLKKLTQED